MKKYEVEEAIKLKKQSHLMIDASLAKLWISARAFTFAVPGSMARPCTMGWKLFIKKCYCRFQIFKGYSYRNCSD